MLETHLHTKLTALRMVLAVTTIAVPIFVPASSAAEAEAPLTAKPTTEANGPHVIDGDVADVLVRVRGGALCSGTPISDTRYVLTAAHCVLDGSGAVRRRTVVRDGIEYDARAVIVDTRFDETKDTRLDVAVLVMDQVIPGPSAVLAASLPTDGSVVAAGFQPVSSRGDLLRGTSPHDLPLAVPASNGMVTFSTAAAGCAIPWSSVEVGPRRLWIPCGLIPGASGGGLFATLDGEIQLLGVISTVSADISANGVASLQAVLNLLSHAADYTHVPESPAPPITSIRVS